MIVCKTTYVKELHFEILSDEGKNHEYDVQFINRETNKLLYETKMKKGSWAKIDHKYFIDIDIVIARNERVVRTINTKSIFEGKRVFISFDSSSLGDTLAWIPYCEEFRKKYKCAVIVSTFMNELFESAYPYLHFVGRGAVVDNLHGMFELGWHHDSKREPVNPVIIPLQKAATNILGLEYREVLPEISFTPTERPIEGKYVCISTKSTAQLKEWYYWQPLVDWLLANGYHVVEISKEKVSLDGVIQTKDDSLKTAMNYLHHADFFIGLSSGLSWLAWAMRKKVFMIANFSSPDHEFQTDCIRITDDSVCNSCWNNPMFRFDKGNWWYCPEHEDTPRQFECHKKITHHRVIDEIKKAGF